MTPSRKKMHCDKHKRHVKSCGACNLVETLYKNPPKRKTTTVETSPTVELFLKALSEKYPNDALKPGLVISYIPSAHGRVPGSVGLALAGGNCEHQWYVSVCRYTATHQKTVLVKSYGFTLNSTIADAMKLWGELVAPPSTKNLDAFLGYLKVGQE